MVTSKLPIHFTIFYTSTYTPYLVLIQSLHFRRLESPMFSQLFYLVANSGDLQSAVEDGHYILHHFVYGLTDFRFVEELALVLPFYVEDDHFVELKVGGLFGNLDFC